MTWGPVIVRNRRKSGNPPPHFFHLPKFFISDFVFHQLPGLRELVKPITIFDTQRLSTYLILKMADPSIDPALARPTQEHLHRPPGVPSSDIFNTSFEDGPDPSPFQLAAAALQGVKSNGAATTTPGDEAGKRGPKAKRVGPLIRKRSGWNAFYKEQFAIYHANNPPETKQNARERKGFSAYAAAMWKQLSSAQKEAYVQRAGEDDALAVSRPVEKLRRKRAGLLDTLGRIVAELETEFGVESLVFWTEKDVPTSPDGTPSPLNEGEAYGIVGSSTGSRYIEVLANHQLGPHQFTHFVHQNQPADPDEANQNLLIGSRKRKESTFEPALPNDSGMSVDDIDPSTGQSRKKSKSNISRDYHDAEFRRLLLALLNNNLNPQTQKTRLPRGFFGPYLEKQGFELIGLPDKPVEIGDGGKIGGWSADALRRNLEAVRNNRVYIRRIEQADVHVPVELSGLSVEEEPEIEEVNNSVNQEQEAARILAESAGGNRRGRRTQNK
jgi:hypothetical protein